MDNLEHAAQGTLSEREALEVVSVSRLCLDRWEDDGGADGGQEAPTNAALTVGHHFAPSSRIAGRNGRRSWLRSPAWRTIQVVRVLLAQATDRSKRETQGANGPSNGATGDATDVTPSRIALAGQG